jgi:hypothetical protein
MLGVLKVFSSGYLCCIFCLKVEEICVSFQVDRVITISLYIIIITTE